MVEKSDLHLHPECFFSLFLQHQYTLLWLQMQASQMGTNDNAYSLALISLRVHNIEPQQLAVYKLYDKLVNSTRIQEVKGVNLKLFSRLFAALVHTDWPMHFLIKKKKKLSMTWMMLLINFSGL